ncbi:MAG: hypothetical protein EBW94_06680 [Proteobacteria bacterium]|nr:hypothetical protein [Pseudomonadota bacterium]
MKNFLGVMSGLLVAIIVMLGVLQLAEDEANKEPIVAVAGTLEPGIALEAYTFKESYSVQNGDSLTIIFEKYNVPLNTTYALLKNDKEKILTKIVPGDKFTFEIQGEKISKIFLLKENFDSFLIDLFIPVASKIPFILQALMQGCRKVSSWILPICLDGM